MRVYECGHGSNGLLVLDGTPTMLIAVEEWNKTDKSQCFHCWYRGFTSNNIEEKTQ